MSQYVKLQQVMVNGVVIKMGGNRIRGHIIGRMLHRGEGVNILAYGQHHDPSRMLAGTAPDPGTARGDPVYLTATLVDTLLLKVPLHIAESRLVCQGGNGTGPEGLSCTEDHLCIFVGLGLVFPGEIQVDIRLFVPLESQEGLEGNVKSLLVQGCPAYRTGPIRHVDTGLAGIGLHLITVKVHIMAFTAVIMGT